MCIQYIYIYMQIFEYLLIKNNSVRYRKQIRYRKQFETD